MTGSPKLLIKKYFNNSSIQETSSTLEEAKNHLGYFWTKEGASNIIVSVDGLKINSYAELVALASREQYKNKDCIEVRLYMTNDGQKSIWPQR
jgi:hypothetical protein